MDNNLKILVVGSYQWEVYAPAIADGLETLGQVVFRINYDDYHFKAKSIIANTLNKFQDRYIWGAFIWRYNREIKRVVRQNRVDLVFLYRCYHIFNSTILSLRNNAIVFSYNNDDPFSGIPSEFFTRLHRSNASYCHLNYVYRQKNIDDYARIGIKNTKLLLPYYLTNHNFPTYVERDIPIAFLGHFEDDGRDQIIKDMLDAQLPVVVFGDPSWCNSKYYRVLKEIVRKPVYGRDYNNVMNRLRIALVFLSKINQDKYTRRCFEIPSTKTLMLCPYTSELSEIFPDGEAAVYYSDGKDLITKAKFYLGHPEIASTIAEGGYNRLHAIGGSELDRVREILTDYYSFRDKNRRKSKEKE